MYGGRAPAHHDGVRLAIQRGNRVRTIALRDDATGALFALATLRGNTQFKLNIVKTHTSTNVAGDFSIRNAFADTNNHGGTLVAIS